MSMPAEVQLRPSYEHALRIIGRYLDAEPAYYVTVLEMDDGFTVRYSPTRQRSETRTAQFSWARLRDLKVFNAAGRGTGRRSRRNFGLWNDLPGGYQDFFRALGHTLDDKSASSVAIDSLPKGVAVSYVCPTRDRPLAPEKRYDVLNRDVMEDMIAEAQRRRAPNITQLRV